MSDIDLQNKIDSFLNSAFRKNNAEDYNEAIRELKAAEVLDQNNPEILYNLGINYSKLGLFRTAIDYFNRLLELPYTFVDILTVKKLFAYSLIKLKDYKSAYKYLNDVIKLAPADLSAINMKGYCLEKEGKQSEAHKG